MSEIVCRKFVWGYAKTAVETWKWWKFGVGTCKLLDQNLYFEVSLGVPSWIHAKLNVWAKFLMTPGEIQLKIIRLSLKLMLILIPIRENIEVWNWKLETCVCPYRYKGEIWSMMINPTLNHVKIIDQSLKLIIEHQSKLITSEHDVCKRLQMKFMWIQIQHVKFGGSTKLHDFYSIRTCKVWGSIKLHHLYSIDYRLSLSLTRWIHLQSIRKTEIWGSNNQDQLYSICKIVVCIGVKPLILRSRIDVNSVLDRSNIAFPITKLMFSSDSASAIVQTWISSSELSLQGHAKYLHLQSKITDFAIRSNCKIRFWKHVKIGFAPTPKPSLIV